MPFDSFAENPPSNASDDNKNRLYVAENGAVRIETRNYRREFSPEEFVGYLRKLIDRKKRRTLPVIFGRFPRRAVFGLLFIFIGFFFASCASNSTETKATGSKDLKIVTVGGSATEIVYALGAGDKLVGVDTSSVYPEAATILPQVGYQRTLSAEGVISLKPSLVITTPDAGPPPAIQQIENAGIRIVRINNDLTVDGAKEKIRQIAEVLNLQAKGEKVIKQLDNDLADAKKIVSGAKSKPKVLFIYARGAGTANVGGTDTPSDAMIKLAGGENPVTGFAQYKPLTAEALVAAQPDVILLPSRGLDSMGGVEEILNLPGVKETPAGKNKKIISVDDMLLLGFTPRLGQGVKDLCEKIH
jgi:iron complex transport system substrate-binding protein